MAKHIVKCPYCSLNFDCNSEPYIKIGRRYAHKKCSEENERKKNKEEHDKEKLEQYILKLFETDSINNKVRRQIKKFKEEFNYSYSGILKALIYFYEVKKGDISKANGGIAIVEWIYEEAFNYYYNLWLTNQKNENKDIQQYIPKIEEVKISKQKRKERKRKLFSFLDKEE